MPDSPSRQRNLTLDPNNANAGTSRGEGMVEHSLRHYGAGRSVLASADGVILAGNKTYARAVELGIPVKEIESDGHTLFVIKRTDLPYDDPRAKELAIVDNRSSEVGLSWDDEVLASFAEDGIDLDQFWFEDELAALLGEDEQGTEGLTDPDAVPEPPAEPITKPGDVWVLGRHRLMCGDSTNVTDVDRLMVGQRAQTTFTDPPYNVGIDYGSTTNDKSANYAQFSRDWFAVCPSDFIAFTPGTVNLAMWVAEIERPKWVCVWRKANQCSSSPLNGFNTWEPILLYGKHPKPIGHDSWDIPVAQADVDHPVPKTVEAWSTFLQAFSTDGALVYDPFAGSGTTFIAAEDTSRFVYGMEISPRYCDVIVNRWQDYTGQTASRETHAGAAD